MNVIILAAGYATRLYPLTLNTAKPLLKVAGKPIINHILQKLKSVTSIKKVYVATNDKFHGQFKEWAAGFAAAQPSFAPIEIVNDGTLSNETRLGPVGDIALVIKKHSLHNDLLVIAGDNLFDLDMAAFIETGSKFGASMLAVFDKESIDAVRGKFGVAIADAENRVVDFEEKPQQPKSTLAATAIYLVKANVLPLIVALSQRKTTTEINAGDMIKELLAHKEPVRCAHVGSWFDIGSKEDFAAAEAYYSAGR